MSTAKLIEDYARKNPGAVTMRGVNKGALTPTKQTRSVERIPPTCVTESPIFIRVCVPIPPRLSDLHYHCKGKPRTKKYNEWRERAGPILRKLRPATKADYPVEVCYVIIPGKGWRSNADVANREKAITDTMVVNGILVDDSQPYVRGCRGAVAEDRQEGETTALVWWRPFTEWW